MKPARQLSPGLSTLPEKIPAHIAIIMDGNGRWAKSRGLPKVAGHKRGAEALRELLKGCIQIGIPCLTVYAFSSENWQRPEQEVSDLMGLLKYYLESEVKALHENGIRLSIIGDRSRLPADVRERIGRAEELTRGNRKLHLFVGLSYGSRQEIIGVMRRIAEDAKAGELDPMQVTEEHVGQWLHTSDAPDPDLLIRTGGEQRLSNFLLWQMAYTELYFTPVLWPDFTTEHLQQAVEEFGRRERRYGTTAE